jgi:hypothetical protein
MERLARYERLLRQHGLLESDTPPSPADPVSLLWDEPESAGTGKVLASRGRSRYVSSKLWRDLGEHGEPDMEDDTEDGGEDGNGEGHQDDNEGKNQDDNDDGLLDFESPLSDPLTGAFLGGPQLSLLRYHPSRLDAMALWETYAENVEPLCKMLHVPSTRRMIEKLSANPGLASGSEECLLFAIYHFAIFSVAEEECARRFGRSRQALRSQYHLALRQALVNTSFLKTTHLAVLQALVLLLLSSRDHYDPHTYWILTGVAIRIAQRIGVHRDGQRLGLSPFQVEMRRRLFFQLMPLEARASQMAGMGASMLPDSWDTQPPLNIDDEKIWPDTAELPQEQAGATDMIFCLSRVCVGKALTTGDGSGSWTFRNPVAAEEVVNRAESTLEEKYIRYCDVINPLHFLAVCMARAGISTMRLRIRLRGAMGHDPTDADAMEAVQLALKVLDTDAAVCAHPGLSKYRWHLATFTIWGTWDACIVLLTTLARRGRLFSPAEADAAWRTVESLYCHHDELVKPGRALYVALGRLALHAWESTPPSTADSDLPEPDFIHSLRVNRVAKGRRKGKKVGDGASRGFGADLPPEADSEPAGSGDFDTDPGNGFDFDAGDWTFWDRLIQDHGLEASNQQGTAAGSYSG